MKIRIRLWKLAIILTRYNQYHHHLKLLKRLDLSIVYKRLKETSMKYSINFSDRYGNETDNIEVTISENSIEIPDLDFSGTLDTLYKTRGFFIETGTVSLPVGKKYPKGGIFSMKKLLKFVGLSREKREEVPEVPEVPS